MKRTTVGLAGAAATAIVAALAVTGLMGPGWSGRVALPPSPAAADWLVWGPRSASPDQFRDAAIATALGGLAAVTACVLAIAAAVVLALGAARAGRRGAELRIHRIVGASRRRLVRDQALTGVAIALGAAGVGAAVGLAVAGHSADSWPGSLAPPTWVPSLLALGSVGLLVVAAAELSVFPALRVRAEAGPALPVPLAVPMTLIALCAIALATAGALDPPAPAPAPVAHGRASRVQTVSDGTPDGIPAGAGVVSPGAITGAGPIDFVTTDCGACYVSQLAVQWHVVRAVHHLADADSFELLGIPLLAGRLFDHAEREPVAIVSRSLAGRHFQGGQAVGRRILVGYGPPVWHRVVGVVADRVPDALGAPDLPRDAVYLSPAQHRPTSFAVLLPPGVPPLAVSGADPPREIGAVVADARAPVRWFAARYRFAGALGLALALAGVAVILSGWGRALRYDLGVRRATGARRLHLTGHVVGRVLLTCLGAWGMAVWMGPLLWQAVLPQLVERVDGPVGAVGPIVALLGLVGLGAVLPALWRATRTAPAALIADGG